MIRLQKLWDVGSCLLPLSVCATLMVGGCGETNGRSARPITDKASYFAVAQLKWIDLEIDGASFRVSGTGPSPGGRPEGGERCGFSGSVDYARGVFRIESESMGKARELRFKKDDDSISVLGFPMTLEAEPTWLKFTRRGSKSDWTTK